MKLTEKYRPHSFDEIVGQENIVSQIKILISRPFIELPHFLFSGPAGTGKTTTAECIARQIFGENWKSHYLEMNASDERKIDDMRNKVIPLLSTRGQKLLFLDEADNLTEDSQEALRRPLEKALDTKVIFSANREWKIIDPIKSRCSIFRYKKLRDEDVLKQLIKICKAEKIAIKPESKDGFLELVKYSHGDLRSAINSIEKLIDEKREISSTNIIALQKVQLPVESLNLALSGDFEKAMAIMEDAYISSGMSWEEVVSQLFSGIGLVSDRDIKIRLYKELAQAEANCRMGGNPLIQLIGFLSFVWVSPHLEKM